MSSLLQNKHVIFTCTLFAVAILTAKDVFIIHEETLVLLCFVLFLIFIYTLLKDMFISIFNERSAAIEKEFNDAFGVKEATLTVLATHHIKQISLLEDIQHVLGFTKSELNHLIRTRQTALRLRIVHELRSKLNLALKKEDTFFQHIQQSANNIVVTSLLNKFNSSGDPALKDACFDEGITLLEQNTINN